MKYKLLIEGGFTGIPKEYEGELTLGENDSILLLKTLDNVISKPSEQMRDGLSYHLKIVDNDKVYQALFDDSNIPMEFRKLIDTIVQEK